VANDGFLGEKWCDQFKVASEIGLHVPCLDAEMLKSWGGRNNYHV
jgi:hypothetical protein